MSAFNQRFIQRSSVMDSGFPRREGLRQPPSLGKNPIITVRNSSYGKVMFSQVSVILFISGGGVYPSMYWAGGCLHTHPMPTSARVDSPRGQTPPQVDTHAPPLLEILDPRWILILNVLQPCRFLFFLFFWCHHLLQTKQIY